MVCTVDCHLEGLGFKPCLPPSPPSCWRFGLDEIILNYSILKEHLNHVKQTKLLSSRHSTCIPVYLFKYDFNQQTMNFTTLTLTQTRMLWIWRIGNARQWMSVTIVAPLPLGWFSLNLIHLLPWWVTALKHVPFSIKTCSFQHQ